MQELHIGEFVLSNELVSMTLAMVSENRDVNTLLRELFTPAGNELYVLPAARYLRYDSMGSGYMTPVLEPVRELRGMIA